MRRWGSIGLVLLARAADAEPIHDPETDFRLDLELGSGRPCIAVPEGRSTAADCNGIDPAAMRKAPPTPVDKVLFVAMIQRSDWSYVIVVGRTGAGPEISDDGAERVAASFRAEINVAGQARLRDRQPPATVGRVNGVQLVTIPTKLEIVANQAPMTVTSYNLNGEKGTYIITTSTIDAHAEDVDALVQESLRTVKLTPAAPAEVMKAKSDARLTFAILKIAMAVLGIVLVAYLVWKRSARSAPPSPAKEASRPKRRRARSKKMR